jgi:hypothetical protein
MPTASPAPCRTCHASRRARQRAISEEAIGLLVELGDIELPAGRGCVELSLSHRARGELLGEGCPVALVEEASRLVLILASDGTVVTGWKRPLPARRRRHGRPGRRSRR